MLQLGSMKLHFCWDSNELLAISNHNYYGS